MWQEEVERVVEDFAFDRLTHTEATEKLRLLGFHPQEARDMLDEAIA
jgi:hypothetical protein